MYEKLSGLAIIVLILASTCALAAADIPMYLVGGTYHIKVQMGHITSDAVIDSGASYLTVPAVLVSRLQEQGDLADSDFLSPISVRLADGSSHRVRRFTFRGLQLGPVQLQNIMAVETPAGNVLVGQSVLQKVAPWTQDVQRSMLVVSDNTVANAPSGLITDAAQSFSVAIPPGWKASQTTRGVALVVRRASRAGVLLVQKLARPVPVTGDVSKTFTQEVPGLSDFAVTRDDYTQIDGAVGRKVEFTSTLHDRPMRGYFVLLTGHDGSWLMCFEVTASAFEVYEPEARRALNSFHRLEQ